MGDSRELDIELVRANAQESQPFRLGIAGRNAGSLSAAVAKAGMDAAKLPMIMADVKYEDSLRVMCSRTRLVISAVGPYRHWGEPLVKACIAQGTDYVDICGEPEFIEAMELCYHDAATKSGSLIISACGGDSLPCDIGVLHNMSQFKAPSVPHSVESFFTINSGSKGLRAHFPTWECAVHGFGSASELRKVRKELAAVKGVPKLPGPRLELKAPYYKESRLGKYALPFPGADASIVKRTQLTFARTGGAAVPTPVHFAAYFTVSSLYYLYLTLVTGAVFQWLAKSKPWGPKLLLRYPGFFSAGVFSHEGPSEQQIEEASFTMMFIGRGYSWERPSDGSAPPDREIVTRVDGPEFGYKTCAIAVTQAAILLALGRRGGVKLGQASGVHTSGAVLYSTDVIERLNKNGINFSLISDKRL
eukprot:jgi/Chlat1/556/Chrsp103S01131